MLPFFIFLQLMPDVTLRDHLDSPIIPLTFFFNIYIYVSLCVYTQIYVCTMYIKKPGMSGVLMTLVCNVSDLKKKENNKLFVPHWTVI